MAKKAGRTTGKKADEGAKLSEGIAYDADGRIVTSLPPPEEGAEYDADGRIVSVPIPPELWEQIRAEQAQADKARKIIARAIAIRDGLIPPPWMKKTKSKAPSKGWQQDRALPIMRALWPPHGMPPKAHGKPPKKLLQKAALAQLNEIFRPQYGYDLSRPTFIRALKKLSDAIK
jgi:hypothetical protein